MLCGCVAGQPARVYPGSFKKQRAFSPFVQTVYPGAENAKLVPRLARGIAYFRRLPYAIPDVSAIRLPWQSNAAIRSRTIHLGTNPLAQEQAVSGGLHIDSAAQK